MKIQNRHKTAGLIPETTDLRHKTDDLRLKTIHYSLITIIVCSLMSVVCYASYKPEPAVQPMGDYVIYQGQTFKDTFYIEDPNGPEGMVITCEPEGLVICEPNITEIEGYPDAKKYSFDYTFEPAKTGDYEFNITATDSVGVSVTAQICFTVKGNAPHVFTGCRRSAAASGTSNRIKGEVWKEGEQLTTWPIYYTDEKIYYQQMALNNEGRVMTNTYSVNKN